MSLRGFGSLTWSVRPTFYHYGGRRETDRTPLFLPVAFILLSSPPPSIDGDIPSHQEPEDLFETISQVLLNALDRDALSGNGAVVHVMCVPCPPLLCRAARMEGDGRSGIGTLTFPSSSHAAPRRT